MGPSEIKIFLCNTDILTLVKRKPKDLGENLPDVIWQRDYICNVKTLKNLNIKKTTQFKTKKFSRMKHKWTRNSSKMLNMLSYQKILN